MAEPKKGKETVLYCTCPTCETRLIVDGQGDVLRAFHEPDEAEAQQKADEHIPESAKEEDGEESSGSETISEPKKEELEKEDEGSERSSESEDQEDDDFKLGEW